MFKIKCTSTTFFVKTAKTCRPLKTQYKLCEMRYKNIHIKLIHVHASTLTMQCNTQHNIQHQKVLESCITHAAVSKQIMLMTWIMNFPEI